MTEGSPEENALIIKKVHSTNAFKEMCGAVAASQKLIRVQPLLGFSKELNKEKNQS